MSDTSELKEQLKQFEAYMIKKGRMAKGIEAACRLKNQGLDISTISRVTELWEAEIEILSEKMPDAGKAAEDMAGMLLGRRNRAMKDFFSDILQEEKADKEKLACRMSELGFDIPFIAGMADLAGEEIERCSAGAVRVQQNGDLRNHESTVMEPDKETGSAKYEKIAETGLFRMEIRILKDRRRIHKRLASSTPIESDYGFLLQYEDWGACKELDAAELYAVLFTLYGKPDSFFDRFKASFNYSFELALTYSQQRHSRKALFMAEICDLKGNQDIRYWRSKKMPEDVHKHVDYIISRGDLNICTILFNRYLGDAFESCSRSGFREFELYQPYLDQYFGYENGEFFEKETGEE